MTRCMPSMGCDMLDGCLVEAICNRTSLRRTKDTPPARLREVLKDLQELRCPRYEGAFVCSVSKNMMKIGYYKVK